VKPTWLVLDEVMDAAAGSNKAVAYATGVAAQTVSLWHQPGVEYNGLGKPSPVVQTIRTVRALRDHGNPKADDITRHIAEALGGLFVPMAKLSEATNAELAAFLKEVSDVLTATADAERDGKIRTEEKQRISSELADVVDEAETSAKLRVIR
jgi:hypothetical protein